ncbi:MAG TPA: LPS assembly protein LptD [Terracidiphilus sp.]|nr:LPS assembly protein LptD [Terracidiphilus sp.]
MRSLNLVSITLLSLCHLQLRSQALTNVLPAAADGEANMTLVAANDSANAQLPNDPSQELLPVAQPEPQPAGGVPVQLEAAQQTRVGDVLTLDGNVIVHYRGYVLRADKVVYHQSTSVLEAEGHLQVSGGTNDVLINASHGDMNLNMHTARFYNVSGSQGFHAAGRSAVYSTSTPFQFTARVLLETGDEEYRLIDGTMTNCRFPRPDWRIISRAINLEDGTASTSNSFFEFLNIPLFYLPYLRHPVNDIGRESGFLIPVVSNSSIKGFIVGEQYYWVINRSMDMVVGAELFSKRGWAPNGDFRYKGRDLDHLIVRWNALLDRGVEQQIGNTSASAAVKPAGATPRQSPGRNEPGAIPRAPDLLSGPVGYERVDQGGVDLVAEGRKDFTPNTHAAGTMEYLSSYLYRLVFNDNFSQAISSEVASNVSLTHNRNGFTPSLSLERFETFASSTRGDEARILHLPSLRYDVLDRPLFSTPFYWGLGSSIAYLSRSEPRFHARNVGRVDIYPHLSMPLVAGGWSVVPQIALRGTSYTISQTPDLTDLRHGVPTISHDPIHRFDGEAGVDIRPPAIERDFVLARWNRVMRHVIEPELTYRFVGGIGSSARDVLLADTTDIATNTNEAGYSLTQRLYVSPRDPKPCSNGNPEAPGACPGRPREWGSWTIAQSVFIDPNFGGALIPGRRNVFDSTLNMSGVAFLTSPRNLAPITSRLRFEAIDNLRVQWDLDYDPRQGQLNSDNLYAGYSWGRTTVGLGHALLNAVDESRGLASTIKSQQLQPFLTIGKPSGVGFNLAANGGYDFVLGQVQYAGIQATYNWDCCGLSFGYRRFQLGSVRDETQYLYSFTLANFGSVGDIRRSNSVFRDPALPPAY